MSAHRSRHPYREFLKAFYQQHPCIKGSRTRALTRLGEGLVLMLFLVCHSAAQTPAPFVDQVIPFATVQQSGALSGTVATKTYYNGKPCILSAGACNFSGPGSFSPLNGVNSGTLGLAASLDGSVATALSVIPLASPASAVITKFDPQTGAELPASSTLGPIFTERAETIGKNRIYIGVSNQDFHFTSFNGQSMKSLQLLDPGGEATHVLSASGTPLLSPAATYQLRADVRLTQNLALLTWGATNWFDLSVGFSVVHSAVSANGYNQLIYVGNGFGANGSLCWCTGTLTPASAPGSPSAPTASGLEQAEINFASLGKTGFGDMLVRAKANVLERSSIALAIGADVRVPTGDANNFLGTGAVAVKPFAALSLYTKQFSNGLVFAPHVNVGWQIAGKSVLGGQISGTPASVGGFSAIEPPFSSSKDYLPDVFTWAAGSEIAVGRHNTIVIDFLGDEIGWIHGIQQVKNETTPPVPFPTTATASTAPTTQPVTGLVSAGRVSFGQYNGAFGYKARIAGNLVATFSALVRFDNNGLTARATPLFGLSYTF
jgi:hypothetical protein